MHRPLPAPVLGALPSASRQEAIGDARRKSLDRGRGGRSRFCRSGAFLPAFPACLRREPAGVPAQCPAANLNLKPDVRAVFFEASPSSFTGEWHVEPFARAKFPSMSDISFLASNTDKRHPAFSHVSPVSQTNMNQQIRSLCYSSLVYPLLVLVTASLEKGVRINK
jgi:hypothetical protein